MGRPKGSKNKPKPDKIKAEATPEVLEQKEQELQEANTKPKQTGTFRVGQMLGQQWGVYATSRFGRHPILVFVGANEGDANKVSKELNDVVSNHAADDVGTVQTGVN